MKTEKKKNVTVPLCVEHEGPEQRSLANWREHSLYWCYSNSNRTFGTQPLDFCLESDGERVGSFPETGTLRLEKQ